MVSEDAVYHWIREENLQAERITGNVRGYGKYPLQVEVKQLRDDLRKRGYDVESLFPETD